MAGAFGAHPRRTGFRSVADYTHRPHEINEVAGLSRGSSMDRFDAFRDKQSLSPLRMALIRRCPQTSTSPESLALLQRIADALERLAPVRRASGRFRQRRTPSSGRRRARRLSPVPKVNRVEMSLLRGIDRVRDTARREHPALRQGPAGQQRPALGRPRHGQVLPGQGGPCGDQPHAGLPSTRPLKLIEIHREDIETLPDLMALLRAGPAPLHRLLRRPVLRRGRYLLQVPQGGAGRRDRGPARTT